MGEPQAQVQTEAKKGGDEEYIETIESMLSFLTKNNISYSLCSHPPAPTSEEQLAFLKEYLDNKCNGFSHEGAKISIIKNMFLKDKRRGTLFLLLFYFIYFVLFFIHGVMIIYRGLVFDLI